MSKGKSNRAIVMARTAVLPLEETARGAINCVRLFKKKSHITQRGGDGNVGKIYVRPHINRQETNVRRASNSEAIKFFMKRCYSSGKLSRSR